VRVAASESKAAASLLKDLTPASEWRERFPLWVRLVAAFLIILRFLAG
jgi:hypothetical protein